jgi:hypothetical protein
MDGNAPPGRLTCWGVFFLFLGDGSAVQICKAPRVLRRGFIRLSVGIEDPRETPADLVQALAAI